MTYAEITAGVCTNVCVCEDPAFAAAQGWVELPAGAGVGWSYDGTTWSAPPPPAIQPTAQQQAQAQVAQLAASVPDQIAQAQADAQTINAITPGAPLTAEQVAALGRHANGWPELLQGVLTLATAAGLT